MIVKKWILITTILLLFLGTALIAQSTLRDLIKEVCPDAEVIWEKEFRGNHQKYIISNNTGHFTFNLRAGIKDKDLNYFKISKDGEIEFDELIDPYTGIELTEKGQILPIIYDDEQSNTSLKNSIQSPVKPLYGLPFQPFLKFSPNLDYYFIDQDENYRPLEIYKSDDGTKLAIPNDIFTRGEKQARCAAKWIEKSELFVYIDQFDHKGSRSSIEDHMTFYLFSFPDMVLKWQYKVDKNNPPFYHSYFDRYLCDYSEKYIIVGSPNVKREEDYIVQFDRNNGFIREIPCRRVQYVKVLPEVNLIFALSNYRHVCLYDLDGNRIIRYKLDGWMMRRDDAYILATDEGKKVIFTGIGHINEGDEKDIYKTDILTLDCSFNVINNTSMHGNIKKYYDRENDQTYFIAIDSNDNICTLVGAKVSGNK